MENAAVLEIDHSDQFVPPIEPHSFRILTETPYNQRSYVLTQVTDQEMLRPTPAPPTRIGQWQYAATDGQVVVDDRVLDGAKVDIRPGARPDALQDMLAQSQWQLNTYRQEAEPWDERYLQ